MSSRDYYNVMYRNKGSSESNSSYNRVVDLLDNDTEFNANQFKLFDDFTTDLRINYNPIRNVSSVQYSGIDRAKKVADPNDSGVDMENGNPLDDTATSNDSDLLENEVMVDTWSSMDSSNSPLTDSGPSASDDCPPSTSSDPPRDPLHPDLATAQRNRTDDVRKTQKDKTRPKTLKLDTLDLDTRPRQPHFLDEDYQPPSRSNIESKILKPHFLDAIPSPDDLDEKTDMTNPNFLDDEDGDDSQKKTGALPKRPQRTATQEQERPRTNYRSTLHYGLDNAARSSERDKRASQLYRGTWPGDRDVWTGQDSASVRSFSSNGSSEAPRTSSNLENKRECVYSLLSLLTLSPDSNADLSGPLLEMSRSVESCIAMRQTGCIPLLVQLIYSKLPRETRTRAAKALRNIIHTQTDDKAGRREARVWRLLDQVRDYCYTLEDYVEAKKEGKEVIEDDAAKHPSQSVAALMKLSFDEEHRHVVCQLGGLQALAALVSGDQAAHGSRTDDNTCLTMRKYAGMTLTNLTFGDGNNKSLLCSFKDFMMALVEQLESPNDDMRQVTAAVLRNLSWRADSNSKQVLREVGAVKGLTKAAMTCQKEATLKSVLSALWNLTAHCSMNKVALCSVDGALGFLVDMLSYNSSTKTLAIVENAGGIMRNVSSHIAIREDYRQILRERNCLSVLLQHLKSPSLTVVSNSCGTLWNLSARCPLDQQFLWDHGAVPMLRSLIHSKHKMIAMGSSAALKNLLNSKPGKTHILSLDSTARNMNLPVLPTLGARKQKAIEQELDQNLAETCDNIEPATSPSTSNREEKNLFTATEKQIAMNLERHRMTSSSPLMGALSSQISLSHSAHLVSYLSCSNTLLKGAPGSSSAVNRSDSKDSVTSAHSDTVFEKVMRTGKVPVPTPRSKDLMKTDSAADAFKVAPVPPPRAPPYAPVAPLAAPPVAPPDDQEPADQPVDYSRQFAEPKAEPKPARKTKKDSSSNYGDYQETDLDQLTDYSLRYAELQSETGSDDPPPAADEDTIKHFATEGTPYETPVIFSTSTSMSDLRVIGKEKPRTAPNIKEHPEVMTHSDEKDTCSIEDAPNPDNDKAVGRQEPAEGLPAEEKRGLFDTKFSSGMVSPEKPVNYCDEGTPGYFSRVSSLSSLGEPTEEDNLAKKNAMASINVDPDLQDVSSAKDKDVSKAVTFACTPQPHPIDDTSDELHPIDDTGLTSIQDTPLMSVQDTPLMFSRSSSLGSVPGGDAHEDQGSVASELSRMPSGCISPSDIPDSPPPPPPRAASPPARVWLQLEGETSHEPVCDDVFVERATTFQVENTPAHFSTATSLSSLTIDDDHKANSDLLDKSHDDHNTSASSNRTESSQHHHRTQPMIHVASNGVPKNDAKGSQTPGADTCKIYFTEDTPAILSKAGSNSNLSVLSIISTPAIDGPADGADNADAADAADIQVGDTSDSSNLSDANDLLEECIQKGIAQVVKNKGPASEAGSSNQFAVRDGPYMSLPLYLRSSTETVKMSHEFPRNVRESPPPLPARGPAPAPPRPPTQVRQHESRLPVKAQRNTKDKRHANLNKNDSLSSLSLESFGSTDREIFEEVVKAGLSSMNPKTKLSEDNSQGKAHSLERPVDSSKYMRQHKSLDRSDKIQHRNRTRDPEFEKNLAAGAYNLKGKLRQDNMSYSKRYGYRLSDDGPPSLPARMDSRHIERSDSLSSLSNDSFGSTDKEVFERCVRVGMNKGICKSKEEKMRVRSDDRLEGREHRGRERRGRKEDDGLGRRTHRSYHGDTADSTLRDRHDEGRLEKANSLSSLSNESFGSTDKEVFERCVRVGMTTNRNEVRAQQKENRSRKYKPDEHSKDSRALFEEAIARGARGEPAKNVRPPSAGSAHAGGSGDNARYTGSDYMHRSNECMAPHSNNTTIESEIRDELNRSNESYADILNGSWSDENDGRHDNGTLTRKNKWVDMKSTERPTDFDDVSKVSHDTWNDNTCPDDVTFPTLSGSVHLISSIRSEVLDVALPDLLEKSGLTSSFSRPDLTNKLELAQNQENKLESLLDNVPEPSYASLVDDEPKFDSIMSAAIEKEATRLAAQLKSSQFRMDASVTSLNSLDLDNVNPPSHLGSLLSLTASGHWDDNSAQVSKKSQKSRKKSLPVSNMVKRALSNSMHQGSSEHLDSNPISFLDNVKPPSEMENIDMESSMISVSSIVSEVAEAKEKTTVVFDFKLPVQDFPMCNNLANMYHDLDKVNPPSLFDEIAESTLEIDQTTAHQVYEDCISNTLNVVTDIPSGSENCTPLPSDMSSVESTPKKHRDAKYLTPKEKRQIAKDRYQTYTITDTDTVTESDVVLETATEEFLTWTKSESDSRSDEYVTATSEIKSKRRLSAKQRRMEDRARYQTQTVDIHNLLMQPQKTVDPEIENLKQRLAAKKTMKQKRLEDAERFRTRTLSEDIPPSPTFVTKDANFENIETTTGYDSLSSNEMRQQVLDDRNDDVFSQDSGHNDDDVELNSTQMQTYTKSFRNYLPVIESPAAVDMCVAKNLKNIEMTASYRCTLQYEAKNNPSSSDFASYEGDSHSDDKNNSDSEQENAVRPKPKIIKPDPRRDESLDSNESQDSELDSPKAIRGKKKAMYVSPYRRNSSTTKKPATPIAKPAQKPLTPKSAPKPQTKVANKTASTSKVPSASGSPKKIPPKSPSKLVKKPLSAPVAAIKPLPLERQGTFTKEESTIPAKDLPVPEKKPTTSRQTKATTPTKSNTSPSRLPQPNRFSRPQLRKANSSETKQPPKKAPNRSSAPTIRSSASNQSLQSNDSAKTVTLASKNSRQGSTSSVNSVASAKCVTKDIESRIAGLWKKVEQSKNLPAKTDKRVWIEPEKTEQPKLIRSSTFEGQPKQQVQAASKQKTTIGIRVSQIPSLKPKTQAKTSQIPSSSKKTTNTKVFARKNLNN